MGEVLPPGPSNASRRLLGLDWSATLPWTFDDITVDLGTFEADAMPFMATHYGEIFGMSDPSTARFLVEPMTPSKLRFGAEMDVFVFRDAGTPIGLIVAHPTDWSTYYVRTAALLRDYRRKMVDEGWTERQLRDALRRSDEHRTNPSASADRIINRAYQDILGRAPDASGLSSYRNQITNHGWDEHDVRDALMNSPEYRQKGSGAMTQDRAREIVRRAYLSVLGREPDPASEPFVQRVLRDHWTEREVARELRNSDEYRNRQ